MCVILFFAECAFYYTPPAIFMRHEPSPAFVYMFGRAGYSCERR